MEWYLAPSNKANRWKIKNTYEENGKMYAHCVKECSRCGGKGKIPYYGHVDEGTCFKCGGFPYEYKDLRAYTKEEYDKMEARNAATREKKAEEARAMAETNRKNWLKDHGISEDELFFFPVGCNTYEIKDYLKEKGARYHNGFGWYFGLLTLPEDLELPDGGFLYEAKFDSIFEWTPNSKYPYIKSGALDEFKAEVAQGIAARNKEKSVSQYIGEVGERIRKVEAIFKSSRVVNGEWGSSFLYTFEICGNVGTWFTQSGLKDLEPGDRVEFSGTVKKHTEYMGVLQTQFSRCIIKRAQPSF